MAKDTQVTEAPEQYGDVVARLEDVVARLEGGTLTLEDSLKAFEDGIRLVRRGEQILNAAEQRIEQLLQEDGKDVVAPLQAGVRPPAATSAVTQVAAPGPAAGKRRAGDDDVPF